ncbi:MAG: hydrolase [Labilithrix sp.]|nr:hydrolase [Labilithrix sp.]
MTLCVVGLLAACSAEDAALPASSSDLTEPSCARPGVHTAPAALAASFPSDAEIRAAGGTPFEDGDRVVFAARGPGPWAVAGSFNGWQPSLALRNVSGDLWLGEASIPRTQSFEYKLVRGGRWLEDPLARNVVWDGIDRGFGARGEMNAVGHPSAIPTWRGRTVALGRVEGHEVWVHYPARYDAESCVKLPSVIIHDGMESLTRGAFAEAADRLYAARPELSAVLVFVGLPSQEVRMAEYTVYSPGSEGDRYVGFLAQELWPRVRAEARVCTAPAARGIAGASLGGLVSTYAGFEHPESWGWVGSQSGSYFWADDAMIRRARELPARPLRVYLDSGCPDDNCAPTDRLASVLRDKGYDFVRVREDGGRHDWAFWRDRLAGMLTHFRDGQTTCD